MELGNFHLRIVVKSSDFRFGSQADIGLGPGHVRFIPKADSSPTSRNVRLC
jgi:hypothetical protein